ncbi:mycofactocin-associated electron transfer flavoprotein alpha subunit [Streptomyces sp. NPDC051921]|uniref:mycofactocin-associated electron transfer flavoprotein alpha subunit n=1 Tax=Streptomyces sp. NPDC051921 TaxID=3155806 RepID=UPI0034279943
MTALPPGTPAVAVLVIRRGTPPDGADAAVAEAGGLALLVGDGTAEAAGRLRTAVRAWCAETGTVTPGTLAARLAPLLAPVHSVLLPASHDGRDLAPRLAAALDRPLLPEALAVTPTGAETRTPDGRCAVDLTVDGPFVATLRGGTPATGPERPACPPEPLALTAAHVPDARVLEVREPRPGTRALPEARRVLGAGAGLGAAGTRLLGSVAAALDAEAGGTRVATDAGWLGHDRQIGTTGITVAPDLYIAFGVSGATHHTGGLGSPRHVVSVNTDPACPMTAMADLGIVADAPGVLAELARRLGLDPVVEPPPAPRRPARPPAAPATSPSTPRTGACAPHAESTHPTPQGRPAGDDGSSTTGPRRDRT